MADKSNRLVLGKEIPVRFSYLYAHEPKENEDDDGTKTLKYQCSVLIPKNSKADKAAFDAHVQAVLDEKFKGKSVNLKMPLRDGDLEWEEKGEAYKGHWFFNCSTKNKPNVVGTEKEEFSGNLKALGQNEIKSGDYGRISVTFFDFTGKSKGVGVGMGNIQKTKDGDPLGSQRSADDDFGGIGGGFED